MSTSRTKPRNGFDTKAENIENEHAVLILSDDGLIRDCNEAGAKLLGCSPKNLPKLHISKLLPKLAKIELLKGERINPYLRLLSRIGHHFEVVSMSGVHFAGKLFFSDVKNHGLHRLIVMIYPIYQGNTLHKETKQVSTILD
ncbi:PAS domain-containing protein [Nitrosomonas sp. Is37]|uniref:PAS domain-containing protein n=1 Tax=Nitrosomonas sp. Is37 TaxID=3080535 RepID=UPI00294AAE22|nr:PAS domain-containing protein [Nitrosomonas sp. Is37]MDV6342953.1 PAS domain-containing protein [Nitrosomonas sp. Is37]